MKLVMSEHEAHVVKHHSPPAVRDLLARSARYTHIEILKENAGLPKYLRVPGFKDGLAGSVEGQEIVVEIEVESWAKDRAHGATA